MHYRSRPYVSIIAIIGAIVVFGGIAMMLHYSALVFRVIQRIHKRIGICDTGPWLRDGGHGTTSMRGFEHCRARAVGSDRGRPQPAAQTCGAGGHRARLSGSALGPPRVQSVRHTRLRPQWGSQPCFRPLLIISFLVRAVAWG